MADAQGDVINAEELAERTGRKLRAVLMWTSREDDPCPCSVAIVNKKRRKMFEWDRVAAWMKRNGLAIPTAAHDPSDAAGASDAREDRVTPGGADPDDAADDGEERDLLKTLQDQLERIIRLSQSANWSELSPAQHARHIDSVAKLVREITTMNGQLTEAKVRAGELIPLADAQDELAEMCKRFTMGIETMASDCASTAARTLIEKGFLPDTVDSAQIERILAAEFRETTRRVRRSVTKELEAMAAA